jgi:phosphoglycolate phosphatase
VSRPAALVFDLDGTLVDSRRDLAEAVNRTRAELGVAALPVVEVTGMVGEGARKLMQRALAGVVDPAADRAAFDRLFARFLEHYWDTCLETTRPYPGVEAMLGELAAAGLPLALLTNKPEATTHRILEHFDLARRFAAVVGGDTFATRKPDPAGLADIARRLARPLAATMMIGDSPTDAATARAAGSRFALALWGFPPPEVTAPLAAELRAPDPPALARALLAL